MRIEVQQQGRSARVSVDGRLDAAWTDTFAARMDELVRAGADTIVVDAARLGFLSSLGIRCLITLSQRLRAVGGSFRLADPSEPVRQVIDLARLGPILLVTASSAVAVPATATTCFPAAWWRWISARVNACGTSSWCITTSGTTTTPAIPS